MKAGHLETRHCRGRVFAWARVLHVRTLGSFGPLESVQYRLFTRLASGASLSAFHTFSMVELAASRDPRKCIATTLRGMRAQLRWRRDQLDLELARDQAGKPGRFNAGAPSCLVAYSSADRVALAVCGLPGHLMQNAQGPRRR